MTPRVVFPDAVEIVRAYLDAELPASGHSEATGAVVDVREPNPWPADVPVIRVRRSGGIDDRIVTDNPRIDLIVWHTRESLAAQLAELCRGLLRGLPGTHAAGTVHRVATFAGPVSAFDEDREQPRYLLTVELGTRGTAL